MLVVVAGFLLLGGDVPLIGDSDHGASGYSFDLNRVKASPISDTKAADLQDVAEDAGADVKATMDELYFQAFVDEGAWGDYGALYELFEGKAATNAERDTDALTLGATADEVYRSIEPTVGTLTVTVLTDGRDRPATAIAEVDFRAEAQRRDGSSTTVSSAGSFFLRPVDGEWRVFAYRLTRDEEPAETTSPTEEPA